MRRKAKLFTLAMLVTATTLGSPAETRATGNDACAGTGTMATYWPYVYSWIDPQARTGLFAFSWTLGACVNRIGLSMTGSMSGWCDLGAGEGVTNEGHRFAFLNVGGNVVFTGEVDGAGSITPNAFNGESCVTGSDSFLVEYAFDERHCGTTKAKFQTTEPTTRWTVWSKACI